MSRYIDANALYDLAVSWENEAYEQIDKIKKTSLEEMSEKERYHWLQWSTILLERTAFKNDVANAQTADVVEVVRCKDCKHYWKNWKNAEPENEYDLVICLASQKDDAFCSEGERTNEK